MIHFTFDDIPYTMPEHIDEMSIEKYEAFIRAVRKPLVEKDNEDKAEPYTAEDRLIDCVALLTSLEVEDLKEYPEVLDDLGALMVSNLDDLIGANLEVEPRQYYLVGGKRYYFQYDVEGWEFKRWGDAEHALSRQQELSSIAFLSVVSAKANQPYSFRQPDFYQKINALSKLPTSSLVATANKLLTKMQEIRDTFPFIYGDLGGPKAGPVMQEHLKAYQWDDIIVQLSETPVFNGPNGTLAAIRGANAIEVLEYLNIKYSRENAERKDYEASKGSKTIRI